MPDTNDEKDNKSDEPKGAGSDPVGHLPPKLRAWGAGALILATLAGVAVAAIAALKKDSGTPAPVGPNVNVSAGSIGTMQVASAITNYNGGAPAWPAPSGDRFDALAAHFQSRPPQKFSLSMSQADHAPRVGRPLHDALANGAHWIDMDRDPLTGKPSGPMTVQVWGGDEPPRGVIIKCKAESDVTSYLRAWCADAGLPALVVPDLKPDDAADIRIIVGNSPWAAQ